jgi:ATP-dependent protease ClpP protease subunit
MHHNTTFFTFFTLLFITFAEIHNIKLDKNNLITLRGEINEQLSSDIIRKFNKYSLPELYLYITSPGGSVIDGIHIIDQLKALSERKIKVTCIADFAASMAFAIFQACEIRYVTLSSILMQHQMSLGIKGSLYNLNNYMDFIKQIDEDLDIMQSEKLKLDMKEFQTKITNDWWLNGKHIVKHNAADQIVTVYCDSELVDIKEEIKSISPYLDMKVVFSKCPLSREPLEISINTKNLDKNNDKYVREFIESIVPSKFINKYKYVSHNYQKNCRT